MRFICVILLIFLLIAGPATAIAVSPGSVSGAAKVSQGIQPAVTLAPKITIIPLPVSTAPVSPMLYVSSDPAGAAVSVNGVSKGKTPLTIGLYPGTYTVLITLAGYWDYPTTVTLQDGSKVAVDAKLQPALNAGALRQKISAVGTISPGLHLTGIIVGATPPIPEPDSTCVSGEHCLTTADAALYYKPGWGYKDGACGYTGINYTVPKYCTSGTPSPITSLNCLSGEYCLTPDEADATLAANWHLEMAGTGGVLCDWGGTDYAPVPRYCIIGTPKGIASQPGAISSVAVANQITRIPVSFVTTSTTAPGATKKPLGGKRQISVVDSFFGFFGGLFSHPSCPEGQAACSGKCVDLQTDSMNCGSCDYTCFDPAVCSGGECVAPSIPQPDVGGLL